MDPQTKQSTADFITHLYKDDPKSSSYLDKKRCELRGYIKKGETTKPLYLKYQEWQEAQQQAPAATPIAVAAVATTPPPTTPPPTPTLPPIAAAPPPPPADVSRLKRQIKCMNSKLNDADEQIGDLQDKLDHANNKLGDVLQNLKEVCEERNRLLLLLEDRGWTQDKQAEFNRYKEVYKKCICGASKPSFLSSSNQEK